MLKEKHIATSLTIDTSKANRKQTHKRGVKSYPIKIH